MPVPRLFAIALLLCSWSAFAQVQAAAPIDGPLQAGPRYFLLEDFLMPAVAIPLVPGQIVADKPQKTDAAQLSGDDINLLKAKVNSLQALLDANLDKGVFITPDGAGWGDGICYTMRSYVVARDKKDSDAVHPVSYSTCQMGSKYHLKTAQTGTKSSGKP
jgi:hypothetical protein